MQDNPRQLSATFGRRREVFNIKDLERFNAQTQLDNVEESQDSHFSGSSFGAQNDGIRQKDYDAKKDVKSCCAIF